MKTVFDGSDGQGHSMLEMAFNGLCDRRGGGGKERRMNAMLHN
jgi:hypothetical protein